MIVQAGEDPKCRSIWYILCGNEAVRKYSTTHEKLHPGLIDQEVKLSNQDCHCSPLVSTSEVKLTNGLQLLPYDCRMKP